MHFHEQGVIGPIGSTVPLSREHGSASLRNRDRHQFGTLISIGPESASLIVQKQNRLASKQTEIDSRSLSILNRCLFQVVDYEHLDRGLTPF